jgi:hypothetical protein
LHLGAFADLLESGHDLGARTVNLLHRSAMIYQHPEGEIIRNALNARHISRPTVPNDNQVTA